MLNFHQEVDINTLKFEDIYDVKVLRAYRKPLTRGVDEGTNIGAHEGELLNSKSEWRQPSIIMNVIISGGAEVVAGGQGPISQRTGHQGVAGVEMTGGEVPVVRGDVRQAVDGVASRTRSRRPMGEGGRVGGKN